MLTLPLMLQTLPLMLQALPLMLTQHPFRGYGNNIRLSIIENILIL